LNLISEIVGSYSFKYIKRSSPMKYFIFFIPAFLIITACKNSIDFTDKSPALANIDDPAYSANHAKIFFERRNNLLSKIGNGTVILRADYGYDGGRHEYKVAENFYYLTGITQPGSALILSRNSLHPCTLFIREKSIYEEIYTGKSPEIKDILNTYKPDTVLSYEKLDSIIGDVLNSGNPVYIDFSDTDTKGNILDIVSRMKTAGSYVYDLTDIINEMRVHKDDLEISMIRKAVNITGEAFKNACLICRPGIYEFEIEAMIEYTFRKYGSSMPAFESIVGSGPNAVILHYWQNKRKMEDGDLLLIDIGAEYGYYASDITRTIPVNGKFSAEQKEIYDLILKAQKAAISKMVPGEYLVEGQNRCNEIIAEGLYNLGLITDPASKWQKKIYFLYPISHYVGLDVHDEGDYGATYAEFRKNMAIDTTYGRLLEKGMVLTVEPGLYFRSDGLSQLPELFGAEASALEIQKFIEQVSPVYEKYKNIGVRIEDDVLITEDGNIILSEKIPKETEEIENMIRSSHH
jgi:Xaa-Pro aminopeptidase